MSLKTCLTTFREEYCDDNVNQHQLSCQIRIDKMALDEPCFGYMLHLPHKEQQNLILFRYSDKTNQVQDLKHLRNKYVFFCIFVKLTKVYLTL